MKKIFNKSILSKVGLLLLIVMLITSTYAWFFVGETVGEISIKTVPANCEVTLYRVEDTYFSNGTYNNSFDFEEFTAINTKTSGSDYISTDDTVKLSKAEDGYILEKTAKSDNQIKLVNPELIKEDTKLFYNMDKIYPSAIVTYAFSIASTNPRHIGTADISFKAGTKGTLDDVISLNLCGSRKLLHSDSYTSEASEKISVIDSSEDYMKIGAGETLWLFFYFKFETLSELQIMEPGKFDKKTNLNDYMKMTTESSPVIYLNYYLTGISNSQPLA